MKVLTLTVMLVCSLEGDFRTKKDGGKWLCRMFERTNYYNFKPTLTAITRKAENISAACFSLTCISTRNDQLKFPGESYLF